MTAATSASASPAAFDRFLDVRAKSDREIAALLATLKVDIAVDLKGYTQDSRPDILSFRPAPIQAQWLGYPGTLGADFIDYVIADETVAPFEHAPFYSEKIVQLPGCYQVNDRKRAIAERTPSRRGGRAAGDGLRVLLLQQQLQDHCRRCSTSGCACSRRCPAACCGCCRTMRARKQICAARPPRAASTRRAWCSPAG